MLPLSHIVEIQTEVRDPLAIQAGCRRLGLAEPVAGSHELFAGQVATGWAIQLPGWRYLVVCDTATGQLRFDDFGGRWGNRAELEKFLQAYAAEKTLSEMRRQGHTVTEQRLADGSIKLFVQLTGSTS